MSNPAISVALGTYNGGRYLLEQLESFASQTRKPDELIVCDDHSSDDTTQVIERFRSGAPFPVRLHVNELNVGFSQNFANAVSLAGGDLIFLADQDDVWQPRKIERIARVLEENSEAGFAFCDARIVDSSLKHLGYCFWDTLGFGTAAQSEFSKDPLGFLLKTNVVAGATMAFRARYRKLVLPVPAQWPHDHWIALVISAVSPGILVDEPLNLYRQHPRQELGGQRKSLWKRFMEARRADPQYFLNQHLKFRQLSQRLGEAGHLPAAVQSKLAGKVRHCAARAALHRRWWLRPPLVLREAATGRYHRFSQGWKSVMADMLT